MAYKKLSILLSIIVASSTFLVSPTNAFAAINNLNGQTGNNQTFANDTNIKITSATNVHTLGWQGLLGISRGGTNASSFTAGSIFFFNGTAFSQDNSNFFWDNTNHRLGIGTSSPTNTLSVSGNGNVTGNLAVTGTISASNFSPSSYVTYTGATADLNLGSHNITTTGSVTSPTLNNLIPYTGATTDVDLASHTLMAGGITSIGDALVHGLTIGLGGGFISGNTVFGHNAFANNTSGVRNVAIGDSALQFAQTNDNTAIGANALGNSSNTGEQNTAVGSQVLQGNTTGVENVGVGFRALQSNTSGIRSVAVGLGALKNNTTASENVAVGNSSFLDNTTGGSNVAVGTYSATHLTGDRNVAIGDYAATYQADGSTYLTSANYGVYIGQNVKGLDNSDSNSIVIGYNATGVGANKAVIGNSDISDIYFGSSNSNASAHSLTLYSGSPTVPGCIVMGDTSGGVGYITLVSGVLTVSSTKPSACH